MQSSPNRIKLSPAQYWFRNFCHCCYKWNDKRSRQFWPHSKQKRLSKQKTLRDFRKGMLDEEAKFN